MQDPTPTASRRAWLFGVLRLEQSGRPLAIPGGKARSLLAYLLLHPRSPWLRDVLIERLWPELPPDRARRNLSDLLYRLQQALGRDWLAIAGDQIGLQEPQAWWVDVWAFEHLIASDNPANLEQAVATYTGDLLPEIYDDWILARRLALEEKMLDGLLRLGRHAEQQQAWERAGEYYRRLVQADPLHENAYAGLMRCLGGMGQFAEALQVFARLEALLRTELAVQPGAEIRALAAQLRAELDLAQEPETGPDEDVWALPFVGRGPERARALEAVEVARRGRSRLLAVEGPAGIGKTRLLQEVSAGARWRNVAVIAGHATEMPGTSPLAPLASAFEQALGGPRAAQMESILAPEMLAALAPLSSRWQDLAVLPEVPPVQARRRFYQALLAAFETLCSFTPHLLALDDLHWATPSVWEILDVLVAGLSQSRLVVLLTYRRPEIQHSSGWTYLQRWEREGRLQVLSLQPLDAAEVSQLLPPHVPAQEIVDRTGGNPFLIGEVLLALAEGRSPKQDLILARIEALPAADREALEAAAVLGDDVPYRLWAAVAALPPQALAEAAERLAGHHLLRPVEDGYEFVHDLAHTAVYEQTESARRRELHGRAGTALRQGGSGNLRVAAFHLDRAGAAAEAAQTYRQAGAQEHSRFAFAEGQAAFERALVLLPTTAARLRAEILLELAQVCDVTGDRGRQGDALAQALQVAHALEDESLLLQAYLAMGRLEAQTGQVEEAETHLVEALTLAQRTGDVSRHIEATFLLGDLAARRGRVDEARTRFQQALEQARRAGDRRREGRALRGLAIAVRLGGAPEEAVTWLEQALAVQQAIGDRLGESVTQINLLASFYDLGAWDRLLETAAAALPVKESLGDRPGIANVYHMQGLAACALGDFPEARRLLDLALEHWEAAGEQRMVGLARNVLGLVAEGEGDPAEARRHYEDALAAAVETGAATEAAYARHDLGALLLAVDEPESAVSLLEAARVTWREQGNELLRLKSEAFLGLALLRVADPQQARLLADQGWAALQQGIPAGEQPQGWLWALHRLLAALQRVDHAGQVLQAAYQELQRQAEAVGDYAMRHRFFAQVPLNRAIVDAYDVLTGNVRRRLVTLASADAPRGRSLTAADQVTVQWTVQAPEDEAIRNKGERRRHVLKRLLAEASAQGAAPTDDDLAAVLGVSRRTILRDREALVEAGTRLATQSHQ